MRFRLSSVVIIQLLFLCLPLLAGHTDTLDGAKQPQNKFGALGTRWLKFPDNISAGELYFRPTTKEESAWFGGKTIVYLSAARGVVPVPAKGTIQLMCTYDLTVHPENLKYIPPDLVAIFDGHALPVTDDICEPLSKLTSVTKLELKQTDVTDRGLVLLSRLPHLKELLLDETDITGSFLEPFKGVDSLTYLSISNDTLSMQGIKNLSQLRHLTVLELCQARVTDDMLDYVGQLHSLEVLRLSLNSKITDDGVRHLRSLTKLHRLDLDETRVTANGLLMLKDLPLGRLSVSDTIGAEGLKVLHKAFPRCAIGLHTKGIATPEARQLFAPLK